jgi:hypothetical protein
MKKNIIITFIIALVIISFVYIILNNNKELIEDTPVLLDRSEESDDADVTEEANPNLGVVFRGKLQEVNLGCFVDGECYVVVDGKHVTSVIGWSQEITGSVIGVDGFSDLEAHIGKDVEVFARKVSGTENYTLYGSADFYIKAFAD